jgi:tryptophan-rich sensory protein
MLWLVLAATLGLFWRVRKAAGALLMPYLAWVSFAAALNFTIWRLNP